MSLVHKRPEDWTPEERLRVGAGMALYLRGLMVLKRHSEAQALIKLLYSVMVENVSLRQIMEHKLKGWGK